MSDNRKQQGNKDNNGFTSSKEEKSWAVPKKIERVITMLGKVENLQAIKKIKTKE